MTLTGNRHIKMIEKDPEGEKCDITVDVLFLHLYHFLPIIELIKELNPREHEGRICGSLEYDDETYSVSVPSNLYERLLLITESDIVSFDELLKKNSFDEIFSLELLSDESNKRILFVE